MSRRAMYWDPELGTTKGGKPRSRLVTVVGFVIQGGELQGVLADRDGTTLASRYRVVPSRLLVDAGPSTKEQEEELFWGPEAWSEMQSKAT